jgi:hypothetical protein
MAMVLVATESGVRAFSETGEGRIELAGHIISALATEEDGTSLAVVDEHDIWRRDTRGEWSKVAATRLKLQSVASVSGTIFAGGADEATILRISSAGNVEYLADFDNVHGRSEWFAGGPPLGVRGLAATADSRVVFAAVHVGGIPRSTDQGQSWAPTIPILFDVHEVRAHPTNPNLIAAAAAVGLCVSRDKGINWRVHSEHLELTNSLAVSFLEDEALFSIQDGPFAKRSQIWRWKIDGERTEQVRDGLTEWLEGKVDTNWIAAGQHRAAVFDRGGNLWLSELGSTGWERIATGLPYSFGLLIV